MLIPKALYCDFFIKAFQRQSIQTRALLVDSQGGHLQDWLHSDLRLPAAEKMPQGNSRDLS